MGYQLAGLGASSSEQPAARNGGGVSVSPKSPIPVAVIKPNELVALGRALKEVDSGILDTGFARLEGRDYVINLIGGDGNVDAALAVRDPLVAPRIACSPLLVGCCGAVPGVDCSKPVVDFLAEARAGASALLRHSKAARTEAPDDDGPQQYSELLHDCSGYWATAPRWRALSDSGRELEDTPECLSRPQRRGCHRHEGIPRAERIASP